MGEPESSADAAGEFCVVCGRTGLDLKDGVCASCSADRRRLISVAPHAQVVMCGQCGARQVGRHWEGRGRSQVLSAEDLRRFLRPEAEVAIRAIRWEETSVDPHIKSLHGDAKVRFRGLEREVPVDLRVRIVERTCPDCSRRSGHFYTALIQLRGPEKGSPWTRRQLRDRLREVWDVTFAGSRPNWLSQLAWSEQRPEGWDHYFVDTLAARGMARTFRDKFGATVRESATLYGRKEGRDLYRVTFAVRLPPHLPGDVYEREGVLYRLDRRSSGSGFEVTAVSSGERRSWSSDELAGARWVGRSDRRVVVTFRRPGSGGVEAQHPESGEWVPVEGAPPNIVGGPGEVFPGLDRLWYAGPSPRRRLLER